MAKQGSSRKVRGSRTGRPIMALLDLLGRRWSLRIIWELREAALTSRALRTACDEASPTILQTRLTELREAGFVELTDDGPRAIPDVHAAASLRGAVEQKSELSRSHRQAGAIGLHDPHPAAGGHIGAGDAPDGVVDPHRA